MPIGDDAGGAPDAGGGAPTPDAGPPGGAPGGGGPGMPGGGGPILAGLMRSQMGPQVSAHGMGDQADASVMMSNAIGMLNKALAGFPPGSPQYNDIANAIKRLTRHSIQGQPGIGVQSTQLRDLLRNTMRNALLQHIMGQGGGGGGAGAGGPGGAAGGPPMPSTPLPGA